MEIGTKSILKGRRDYNRVVSDETIEDYALRYSPAGFRNWSEFVVSNTAIGSISFLALEAIGASIAISYGFQNAFWGILTACLIIFILGIPICYQAAKHNLDIDLLTRAAGFGYLGSTVTSLIYASFCFIFFALEAAIMAQALYLYLGLPLSLGYAFCSLIILPIVHYGMTAISRFQMLTQPLWLVLMLLPFAMVLTKDPQVFDSFLNFKGSVTGDSQFSWQYFGLSLGISLSLIAQIGEQVDYLRFMPEKTKDNRIKWWAAVLLAGPGWAILGFLKQVGGILLAALVLLGGASLVDAREPFQMYSAAYHYVFENPEVALLVSFIFVIVSQLKINVTNAYAGSLAWSNFFSRITHTHLGRAVWVVFNIAIALLLMLLGVFEVLEKILGLYSNVAIAWIAAIFADLVINKPLGFSPPVIEFKRAYLFNINPVGAVSTSVASVLSIIAFSGILGPELQAFSSILALVTALILSPLISYLTNGKYYIARKADSFSDGQHSCGVCDTKYDAPDMAICPMHSSNICSLCCSVEARCNDLCKIEQDFSIKDKVTYWVERISKGRIQTAQASKFTGFSLIYIGLLSVSGFLLWTSYIVRIDGIDLNQVETVKTTYLNIFYLFSLIFFVGSWLIVLMQESRSYVEMERKIAKDELATKEAQLRMAMDYMPGAMAVVDSELKIVAVNDTYSEYFGDPEGLIAPGASMPDILKSEIDRGLLGGVGSSAEILEERIKSLKPERMVVFEDRSLDGRHIQLSRTPAPDNHSVTVAVDITERKHAEQALQKQTELIQLLHTTAVSANQNEEIDIALQECLDAICKFNSWPIGHVYRSRPNAPGILVSANIWHMDDPERFETFRQVTEQTSFKQGVGLPGRVFASGKPEWVTNVVNDPNFPRAQVADDIGIKAGFAMPVLVGDDVIAIMEFFAAEAFEPDQDLLSVLANISAQYGRVVERKRAEEAITSAHNLITASINYASNIQRSLLPASASLDAVFSDHFVIWEPRDVVGGDIYWMRKWGNGTLLILADCTGHGVPGAFMTLIATGAIDNSLKEVPVGQVGNLLQRVHQLVQNTLGQDGTEGVSDDGLELGMCYLMPDSDQMIFSGARFDLYQLEDGELTTTKGTKSGIGYRGIAHDQEFEEHQIDDLSGKSFYMTSDGLVDQVGGERTRMFGKKRLRELLLDVQSKGMKDQGDAIYQAMTEYMGSQTRRDDVAVIGFRVL